MLIAYVWPISWVDEPVDGYTLLCRYCSLHRHGLWGVYCSVLSKSDGYLWMAYCSNNWLTEFLFAGLWCPCGHMYMKSDGWHTLTQNSSIIIKIWKRTSQPCELRFTTWKFSWRSRKQGPGFWAAHRTQLLRTPTFFKIMLAQGHATLETKLTPNIAGSFVAIACFLVSASVP